jgi:hypothetical protein
MILCQSILSGMTTVLRRAVLSVGCLAAVLAVSVTAAAPAGAATFTTRCVVARDLRIYHTATSSTPGHTRLHFGTTIYTDLKSHNRYRAWWYTLAEGWHRGWISANPTYTHRGACGQLT